MVVPAARAYNAVALPYDDRAQHIERSLEILKGELSSSPINFTKLDEAVMRLFVAQQTKFVESQINLIETGLKQVSIEQFQQLFQSAMRDKVVGPITLGFIKNEIERRISVPISEELRRINDNYRALIRKIETANSQADLATATLDEIEKDTAILEVRMQRDDELRVDLEVERKNAAAEVNSQLAGEARLRRNIQQVHNQAKKETQPWYQRKDVRVGAGIACVVATGGVFACCCYCRTK